MEIKFLGVSGATPTKERNLPALALKLESGKILLFDAGEDVQRRFVDVRLRFNSETTIFITHLHGDHVIGLPGLLFNFHLNNRTAPLTIIGPIGCASFLLSLYKHIGLKANNYVLTVIEVPFSQDIFESMVMDNSEKSLKNEFTLGGKESYVSHKILEKTIQDIQYHANLNQYLIVYSNFLQETFAVYFLPLQENLVEVNKEYNVRYMWVDHSVPTLAYRFEENDRSGKFDKERALKSGIPKGHLWGQMQRGKPVKHPDGHIIDPTEEGIVGQTRPGAIIVITGDTTFPLLKCQMRASLIEFCKDADYLICESTFSEEHHDLAVEKKHMTAKMAAQLAKESHVTHLLLTHFSSRYKDLNVLEYEAQEIFKNSQCAQDLLEIDVVRKEN